MKKLIILVAAFSALPFGCGNPTNEKSEELAETVTSEKHPHGAELTTIELNKGEKWKVDTNMITHIRNMESDVSSFANAEQKDYEALSVKLQSNIDLLTSNCTMKGKAHDELHKWLLPYIDMVEDLSEAKDETAASKQFENIRISFATFNQYFQ